MTAPRLAPSVFVGALIRRAEAEGGFPAVLAKGDPQAGAVLVVLRSRGEGAVVLERLLGPDGGYRWQRVGEKASADASDLGGFLERRRSFDPDLWIVELDVASAERFATK